MAATWFDKRINLGQMVQILFLCGALVGIYVTNERDKAMIKSDVKYLIQNAAEMQEAIKLLTKNASEQIEFKARTTERIDGLDRRFDRR